MKSHLREERIYFGLQFQMDRVHHGREDMASRQEKHGERTRKLAAHMSVHTQGAERVKDEVISQQSQPEMMYFRQQGCTPITFPSSATNCSNA